EGYEMMRDLINSRFGGVMGRRLVLVVGGAPDPTAAASEATRLATREGVKIITGTFSSILCGAASEAAARQNVIYWETSCVDPRFTRRGLKNVFRTEIDGLGFGWYNIEFIAKYLAPKLGKKPSELRIAFIAEDSSYGQGATEAARERAKKEFGMQEVALEYYTYTTNDLTPVILELGTNFILDKMRPEGQKIERAFREAVKKKTGSDTPNGGQQLAAGGLWLLKVVLDNAKTDELDKFRAAVMKMDIPVGSLINGW